MLEIRAFLQMRLGEVESSGGVAFANQFATAPPLLRTQSADKITRWLDAADAAIEALSSSELTDLVNIKTQGRWLDRRVASLAQKVSVILRDVILTKSYYEVTLILYQLSWYKLY